MAIDYLIRNGTVIDGARKDSVLVKADIAIEGDRIREIGTTAGIKACMEIDAEGLCVCPGFIDAHAHSEFTLLADGRAEGKTFQGVTTEINGNCGLSAAPLYGAALEQREKELDDLNIRERWNSFPEYFALLQKKGSALNFATLAGHGNIRASAAGYTDRRLSDLQKEKMLELLRDAMDAGAKGLSTGLIYPPGIYSDTSEISDLAVEAAKRNGIYTTHMRSEGDRLAESIDEVIAIAERSGIHAHISHLKTAGMRNWDKLGSVLLRIEEAQRKGISLTCDRYPYIAAGTDLDAILPAWAFEGGRNKELQRLSDERQRLTGDILENLQDESSWDRIMISSVNTEKNKWMEGRSITEASRSSGKPPVELVFDLLIEEDLQVAAIFFSMNEENLRTILRQPYTAIGSDSSARSFSGITAKGKPHPRGFGSFPRVLGMYAREEGIMTLSEAVYKMTGLPAKIFRLDRRGTITDGYFADLVVFDPERVHDRAGFNDPFRRPEGIHHVFINGIPAVLHGELTGSLPGRIIR